jgi:phosphoglycolate phosphatase-like HAD superfamily hydrolase
MKLAIFDIDGTLTNTNKVDDECFVEAFAKVLGIADIDTDWAAYPHTTDEGITLHVFREKLGCSPEETELAQFKRSFVNMMSEQYRVDSSGFAAVDGAAVALSKLKQDSDWAVAIATGCWRDSASLKLRAAGLDTGGIPAAYAEDALSREDILRAALARALEHYEVSGFEKVVSIGDGVWDVRTAGNLGFAFLGIGLGEAAAKLRQAGAKQVIADFSDYEQLIKILVEAEVPSLDYFNLGARK